MKINATYLIAMLVALLGCSLIYIFKNQSVPIENTIEYKRNDSIINSLIEQSKVSSANYIRLADSLSLSLKELEHKDSIEHSRYTHDKIKLTHLNPSQRDILRDSILRANKVCTR
ncbi:hypothetical protein UFOVP606_23 [uncultured Caudovirales phage]|uniref:Uncharacterized protein n=1 Tax=uncultured Caudovirales phage TaxID=2100421 RepID=A0A6J5N0Q3_9CAUD|nr:hypothetical protein UFOVP606_23 [uncultured Caudovirales phage]